MVTIRATVPCVSPPSWAVLERHLFAVMDEAASLFVEKYTRPEGGFIWRGSGYDNWQTRDGADDFYESLFNWPLLYVLGGGDHLLTQADKQWEGITRQLTTFGLVHKEFERGYDWFHQGESCLFLYLLCLADPTNPKWVERARRFAGFYLNEDPDVPNYDAEQNIIRAPHNGSDGPRWGYFDTEPVFPWVDGMKAYGLPYMDIPGLAVYDDLKDPALGRRMGEAMDDRMGKGDVVVNLAVTGLMTNAYLLTGDEKYKDWVIAYTSGWMERAERNGGIIPDNVGLSGKVGEYTQGKWYGGLYGWTWPHGFHTVGAATTIAGSNAFLLTNDARFLDLPRLQMDHLISLGKVMQNSEWDQEAVRQNEQLPPTFYHFHAGQAVQRGHTLFVVPFRHGDEGWFDYQSLSLNYPAALWNLSHAAQDWERIESLRKKHDYDWRPVYRARTKEENGHEEPWLCFIRGENPDYPEHILQETYAQIVRRMELMRQDHVDLLQVSINHWQFHNPILTEALVQLTLGAPQPIYNGGILYSPLRYFDTTRRRPGLPPDVAALITLVEAERVVVHLVNLSATTQHDLMLQAGSLGEHQFQRVAYSVRTHAYPGPLYSPGFIDITTNTESVVVNEPKLYVQMPPGTEILLDIQMERFVHQPSYHQR